MTPPTAPLVSPQKSILPLHKNETCKLSTTSTALNSILPVNLATQPEHTHPTKVKNWKPFAWCSTYKRTQKVHNLSSQQHRSVLHTDPKHCISHSPLSTITVYCIQKASKHSCLVLGLSITTFPIRQHRTQVPAPHIVFLCISTISFVYSCAIVSKSIIVTATEREDPHYSQYLLVHGSSYTFIYVELVAAVWLILTRSL